MPESAAGMLQAPHTGEPHDMTALRLAMPRACLCRSLTLATRIALVPPARA